MGQNNDPLITALQDPLIRGFVGAGIFISILMITNDVRKRLFIALPETKDARDELSKLHQEIIETQKTYIDILEGRLNSTTEEEED